MDLEAQILDVLGKRQGKRTTFLNVCQYFPYNERKVRKKILELRDEGKIDIDTQKGRVLISLISK